MNLPLPRATKEAFPSLNLNSFTASLSRERRGKA
jgi:hypothetical protein